MTRDKERHRIVSTISISISIIISSSGIMTTVTSSSSVIGGATTARVMQTATQLPVTDHVKRRAMFAVMDEEEEEEEEKEEEEGATVDDTAAALHPENRSPVTESSHRCDETVQGAGGKQYQTISMNTCVNSRQRDCR